MIRRFRDVLLVVFSAALLGAAYQVNSLGGLAFVAFVPFFFAIDRKGSGDAAKFSYLFGFLVYLLIGYPLLLVTVAGYLVVAAYLAVYFALFGIACASWNEPSVEGIIASRREIRGLFYLPAVWVALEYFRGWFLSGLPWAFLGYTQWRDLAFIQIADITAVYGVSFFIIFVNLAVFKLAQQFFSKPGGARTNPIGTDEESRRRYRLTLAGMLAGGFLLVGGYGAINLWMRDAFYRSPDKKAVLRVAVVQGDIPQDQKWNAQIKSIIFEKYKRLTFMSAIERSDLIVWPETSFPGFLEDEAMMAVKLRAVVRKSMTNVLVGAPTIGDLEKNQGVRFYNSAILFGPDGEERARYHKLHLVPFGEYIPLRPLFGFLRRFVEIGDFTGGHEWTLFDIASRYRENPIKAKFAALICYEDMFPALTRRFVAQGADFLLNITNDAWFGDTTGPYQHGQSSIFRAVENRVNVVRAGNTGWSCFISPEGRILSAVQDDGKEINVTGHKSQDIVLRKGRTFYNRFGDVFVYLCLVLCFLAYRDKLKHSQYSRL